MKLLVVFFTFLAVQGWTSARSISEDSDVLPDGILELMASSELPDLEFLSDFPQANFNELSQAREGKRKGDIIDVDLRPSKPEKCLPYIQDAYNIAVEVRGIVAKAHELGQKLKEGVKKCLALTSPEEKKTCFAAIKKQAITEGTPLKKAFLEIRPKLIDIMTKFDNCMAGKTDDVNSKLNSGPEKCLPYVQEAYNTAVEVRRIVGRVHELAKKLVVGFKKCVESTENDKKACFQELHKQALEEGKPIKDAYLKIHPKINELFGKFEQCLA